jgi:asparagine synthase (glutamine-hydrolysing)
MHLALGAMRHRGPDHLAVCGEGPLLLGHVRLAILDLSAAANQPMEDHTGRYLLAFNGEVFNHEALREILRKEGVAFHTRSDTEVLLHWLIHRGVSGLNDISGFFALALYDRQTRTLTLARDRMGEKPLWYCPLDGGWAFASELRGLKHLAGPWPADPASVAAFLSLTYIPAPYSYYESVRKLLPGEALEIAEGGVHRSSWVREKADEAKGDASPSGLRDLLDDAVRIRMAADVPVGALLSGGLDSSVIAVLAARHTGTLRTYSASFPDDPYLDEQADARRVADAIGSTHTDIPLTDAELLRAFSGFVQSVDEPFADASGVAMQALCRIVKKDVTVALTGDGADELFGGYRKHIAWQRAARTGAPERAFWTTLAAFLSVFPAGRGGMWSDRVRQIRRFADGLSLSQQDRYFAWLVFSRQSDVAAVLSEDSMEPAMARFESLKRDLQVHDILSVLRADQQMVLPNDMLMKADWQSMAHSLELRAPFLDHRVVSFSRRLRPDQLVRGTTGKWFLREAFRELLPPATVAKGKQGFEIPLDRWLRTHLREEVMELASSRDLLQAGCLNSGGIHWLTRRAFERNDSSANHLVFSLLVLNRWLRSNHSS